MRRALGAAAGHARVRGGRGGQQHHRRQCQYHECQREEQDRAFPVCDHLRVLAEGQRYRLGRIHRGRHHQYKYRPCPFSAGNIPGHSSPDRLPQSSSTARPACWYRSTTAPTGSRTARANTGTSAAGVPTPAWLRAVLRRNAKGGARVETAQGLPADHQRARADPRRGRGLAAQPVGGAAPVSPPGPPRPASGPAGPPPASAVARRGPGVRPAGQRRPDDLTLEPPLRYQAGGDGAGRPRPPRGPGHRSADRRPAPRARRRVLTASWDRLAIAAAAASRSAAGWPRTPASSRRRPERAQHPVGLRRADRGQRHGPVGEQFRPAPARAHHQNGPSSWSWARPRDSSGPAGIVSQTSTRRPSRSAQT